MKNVTRAFVLVLALTGVAASARTMSTHSSTSEMAARSSFVPQPMCPPDGSTDCGFGH